MITATKYKKTRNFAVYLNGELLPVTVYKKGAEAVAATLQGFIAKASPAALTLHSAAQ